MVDMNGATKVYVEWVILENFLIDGGLLCVALFFSKQKIVWWRLGLASLIGSLYALFFPLVSLPRTVYRICVFAVGGLIVYVAIEKWKGWIFTTGLFFLFAFALSGGMVAVYDLWGLENKRNVLSIPACLCGLGMAMAFFFGLFHKVYKKQAYEGFIYDCALYYQGKKRMVRGFLDSGNRVKAKGRGIVFLDGRIFFELVDVGTKFEEVEILTMTGSKRIKIFLLDRMEVYKSNGGDISKEVYCAPAPPMKKRDYEMILNADALEKE